MNNLNLSSMRAKRARLGNKIGTMGRDLLVLAVFIFGLMALFFGYQYKFGSLFYLFLAMALTSIVLACWQQYDLSMPAGNLASDKLEDLLNASLLGSLTTPVSPRSMWFDAVKTKEGSFFVNRMLISVEDVANLLSNNEADSAAVWHAADIFRSNEKVKNKEIHGGTLAAVLLDSTDSIKSYLSELNFHGSDIIEISDWLDRVLTYSNSPKPYFGGMGRDWAMGFTPTLNKFSQNISQIVELGNVHFHFLAQVASSDIIVNNLIQGSGGVAIVGQTGTGKTGLVHAVAERLLLGVDGGLKHHQIISLNASQLLSTEKDNLEQIMLQIFYEAVQAGNIILFLDEAQLFFGDGAGAFNMAQILLPVLQTHRVKIIAAFTANDFQRLKSINESLVSNFSVVTISEPPQESTYKVLEDTALTMGARTGVLITYEAIREAYRLSEQYMSELAFPGKGISLLDQSLVYSENKVMTAKSVQTTIEKTLGIKVGAVGAEETDVLLNLEDKIHERMINQTQAVSAIAGALRRVRAGVTSPYRPAGSFLFLGPTGVGKTELAKSLAATYYGSSDNMIRLDMSEYQQASDVSRLLGDGANSSQSLILAIRKQPFSVVLLDEIEKAHPNILNLLLQLLDEGMLTDSNGRPASFRSAIIITTSNAGSNDIIEKIAAGESLSDFERPLIDKLISTGQFRPELINRYDEVVLFRPLNEVELLQVAKLMIDGVNKNLAKQSVSVELTDAALAMITKAGYDPEFGARPMRHIIQKTVEDVVATRILQGQAKYGSVVKLDVADIVIPQ